MKKLLWTVVVLIVVVGTIFFLRYITAPTVDPNARRPNRAGTATAGRGMPQPVKVATAKGVDTPIYLTGLGTVTAANTVTVRSRVNGELVRVNFTEGSTVKAGQVLAEIDSRPFEVALSQAEGQVATTQASLETAKVDLQRYQALISQNTIARQTLDTQLSQVKQLEGTLKANQAAAASARLQLQFTKIVAPISGRVGLRNVDIGNQVSTSDPNGIVVITQTQPSYVVFPLPEANLNQVLSPFYKKNNDHPNSEGLMVQAWNRDNTEILATGKLSSVDNQVDTATGTFRLKAVFENTHNELFPNQFVNARIQTGTLAKATVIPTSGVQVGREGNYVWLLGEGNKVRIQPIKVGQRTGETIVITEGIQIGERVVTDGVDRLKEGTEVMVAEDLAQAAEK